MVDDAVLKKINAERTAFEAQVRLVQIYLKIN